MKHIAPREFFQAQLSLKNFLNRWNATNMSVRQPGGVYVLGGWRWEVGGGRLAMGVGDGRWKVGDGRWQMEAER
jgi:hypothetical protein